LDRYAWTAKELGDAIGGLLADKVMKARLRDNSQSIASRPGSRLAAAEIMRLV